MKSTNKHIMLFCLAVLILFTGFIFVSDDVFSSYVTIDFAKKNHTRYVQVYGQVNKSRDIQYTNNAITFELIDENQQKMTVQFDKILPNNFFNTDRIVAVGKYNNTLRLFIANKLLVKCPSKYQLK